MLSDTSRGYELVDSNIDFGHCHGVTVICDLLRRLTDATETALGAADLIVVSRCDVRACAATTAVAPVLVTSNLNLGLVGYGQPGVRPNGPQPGSLAHSLGWAGQLDWRWCRRVRGPAARDIATSRGRGHLLVVTGFAASRSGSGRSDGSWRDSHPRPPHWLLT